MPLTRFKLSSIADGGITSAKLAPNITDSGTGHTQVAKGTTAQRSFLTLNFLMYFTFSKWF